MGLPYRPARLEIDSWAPFHPWCYSNLDNLISDVNKNLHAGMDTEQNLSAVARGLRCTQPFVPVKSTRQSSFGGSNTYQLYTVLVVRPWPRFVRNPCCDEKIFQDISCIEKFKDICPSAAEAIFKAKHGVWDPGVDYNSPYLIVKSVVSSRIHRYMTGG
jgi:hypothetical protein